MGILLDASTKVIVQGITGAQAQADSKFCLEYGTNIVAGVAPGRAGQTVHVIPVYDTVRDALREHDATFSILYVPAGRVKDAALEAIDGGIAMIQIISEGVPYRDFSTIYHAAERAGARVNGPNSNGIITVGQAKIGIVGNGSWCFQTGRIGIVSRSGGMTHEIGWELVRAGMGVSTCVSIGGDYMIGLSFRDVLELFADDPGTDAVVMLCDPGGVYEEEAAAFIRSGAYAKPVAAYIGGRFIEEMPRGVSFGHAGAMIEGESGRPSHKERILREAGVHIADTIAAIPPLLVAALNNAALLAKSNNKGRELS